MKRRAKPAKATEAIVTAMKPHSNSAPDATPRTIRLCTSAAAHWLNQDTAKVPNRSSMALGLVDSQQRQRRHGPVEAMTDGLKGVQASHSRE